MLPWHEGSMGFDCVSGNGITVHMGCTTDDVPFGCFRNYFLWLQLREMQRLAHGSSPTEAAALNRGVTRSNS